MREWDRAFAAALFAVLAIAVSPSSAHAQAEAAEPAQTLLERRATQVLTVLQGERDVAPIFAPAFLAQIDADALGTFSEQMVGQYGAALAVEKVVPISATQAVISIRFVAAIGTGPMQLETDAPHRITGLLLNEFAPIDDSPERIEADIAALPGQISVLYAPLEGEPHFARDPYTPRAVGSTFKLYVLSALARSIARGEHRWDEVVRLNMRSLPSGQMHRWPVAAPVTIQTLATMMIAISDNTATDQLMAWLGREAVEAELRASGHANPHRTLPLLTTLELFAIKGDPLLAAAFVNASGDGDDAQRRVLAGITERIAGDPERIAKPTFTKPTLITDVEWIASADDLKLLMRQIVAQEDPTLRQILAVNPSLSARQRARWAYVGFKGGSEPGVLNTTWLLQDAGGAWHMLTITWNDRDAPVDQSALEALAQRILALPID